MGLEKLQPLCGTNGRHAGRHKGTLPTPVGLSRFASFAITKNGFQNVNWQQQWIRQKGVYPD